MITTFHLTSVYRIIFTIHQFLTYITLSFIHLIHHVTFDHIYSIKTNIFVFFTILLLVEYIIIYCSFFGTFQFLLEITITKTFKFDIFTSILVIDNTIYIKENR